MNFLSNGVEDLGRKLENILRQVKEVVDLSLHIKSRDINGGKYVAALWEDFLRQFFLYVRKRGNETGQNLMNGISFTKITKR